MNVNDCLSLEGVCNVANEETEEFGVDVTLKNLNQTHHLYKVDAIIGDLFVYCEQFALNSEKIYCKFIVMHTILRSINFHEFCLQIVLNLQS